MKVGILLSEEATHRLSDIYNKSAKLSKAEKDSLLSLGLAGKNPTFDDFYIALYLLSLLGKGNHV